MSKSVLWLIASMLLVANGAERPKSTGATSPNAYASKWATGSFGSYAADYPGLWDKTVLLLATIDESKWHDRSQLIVIPVACISGALDCTSRDSLELTIQPKHLDQLIELRGDRTNLLLWAERDVSRDIPWSVPGQHTTALFCDEYMSHGGVAWLDTVDWDDFVKLRQRITRERLKTK